MMKQRVVMMVIMVCKTVCGVCEGDDSGGSGGGSGWRQTFPRVVLVVHPAGSSRGRTQAVAVPGALYLLLLLAIPFVLYHLRPRPSLLVPAALCYLLVVLPRALGPQLPQASPLWLPRTFAALLLTR